MKKYLIFLVLSLCCFFSAASRNTQQDFQHAYPCSSKVINNLTDLCRVWGVLKYYHPGIAQGKWDWDQELLKFLPRVTKRNFHQEISRWISDLKLDQNLQTNKDTIRIKHELFKWISTEKFGKRLSRQLNQIICSQQPVDTHYYVSFDKLSVPHFPNEKQYPDINLREDCNYRILTLFRIWNAIEYLYPYKDLTNRKWDSVLPEHIAAFLKATDEETYYKALFRFTAEICDSHIQFFSSTRKPYKAIGLEHGKRLPFILEYVENKYVITKLLTDHTGLKKGDIVTHIGHKSLDSLSMALKPYIASSNKDAYHAFLCTNFIATQQDSLPVTILHNENEKSLNVTSCAHKTFISLLTQGEAARLLNDSIGYIDVSKLSLSSLPSAIYKTFFSKGLILDLREYPKEFLLYHIGTLLFDKTTLFAKTKKTGYGHLGIFDQSENRHVGMKNPQFYKGKVVLLVNSATMSQGEYTAMAWQVSPNATTIGSTTAGTDGNVAELPLPAGIRMMFSSIGVYGADESQTQRRGIRIDEDIRPTIRGIREGRDELLERAIEIINKKQE